MNFDPQLFIPNEHKDMINDQKHQNNTVYCIYYLIFKNQTYLVMTYTDMDGITKYRLGKRNTKVKVCVYEHGAPRAKV